MIIQAKETTSKRYSLSVTGSPAKLTIVPVKIHMTAEVIPDPYVPITKLAFLHDTGKLVIAALFEKEVPVKKTDPVNKTNLPIR